MVHISRSALLPYSAAQMFALVNDIGSYPQFMQGCLGAQVLDTQPGEVTARLELGKAGLRCAFTTRNLLRPPTEMDMQLVDGPFRQFGAQWRFEPLSPQACKASFDLRFEFSAGLVDAALRGLFEATGRDLVDAVCKQAEKIYGKGH